MWPMKRKKKSARKELKQVYFYPNDYIILKSISKQQNRSMTQTVHDMMKVYVGYQEGIKEGQIKMLEFERAAAGDLIRQLKKELDLYKQKFGKIEK